MILASLAAKMFSMKNTFRAILRQKFRRIKCFAKEIDRSKTLFHPKKLPRFGVK